MTTARKMKKGKQPPKKGTKKQQNLGVSDEEIKRAVAVDYTIDANKRKYFGDEPKMTE